MGSSDCSPLEGNSVVNNLEIINIFMTSLPRPQCEHMTLALGRRIFQFLQFLQLNKLKSTVNQMSELQSLSSLCLIHSIFLYI